MFWQKSPSCGAALRTTVSVGATLLPNGVAPPGRKHCSLPVKSSTWPTFSGRATAAGQSGVKLLSIPARPAVPGCSANAVSAVSAATSHLLLDPADIPHLHARQAAVRTAHEPDCAQLGVLLHLPEHQDRVGLTLGDPHLVPRAAARRLDPRARGAGLVVHPRVRA